MDSTEIWKFISAALACTISLSKIGIPTVIAIYQSNYLMAILSSCAGSVFGTIVFTYLSAGLLKWWDKLKDKWFTSKHPKKIFTKSNRRVIRIKHRFGLTGIAILTPIFLSIPIGSFLATLIAVYLGKDTITPIKIISALCIIFGVFLVSKKSYKL